jgi:hypothetical protein
MHAEITYRKYKQELKMQTFKRQQI